MLHSPNKLQLKISPITAPIFLILEFIVRLGKAYQEFCQKWLQGWGLAAQNLEGIDFSGYYQNWQNLKGTDFSQCNLRQSNFKGVIGGRSVVRSMFLLVALGLAWLITVEVSPDLNEILQTLGTPTSTQTADVAMILLPALIFLLKMFSELLSGKQLPLQLKRLEKSTGSLKLVFKKLGGIILTFLSVLLVLTAYLLVAFLSDSSTGQKLGLLTIVLLLMGAALAILTYSLKSLFRFRTCFVEADLEGACFVAARFPGCSFSKANLRAANFQRGNFRSCNFNGADLREADFRGTDLSGASFKGAKTDGAIGLKEAIYGTGK